MTSAQTPNHKIENHPGIPASKTNEFRDDIEDRNERRKVTLRPYYMYV